MARLNSYQGNGGKKKAHVKHWLIFAMHSLLRGLEINNINKFKVFTEASASVYSILVLAATLVWKPDFCSKSWIASLPWLFLWENLDWTVKFTIDAWKYLFFFSILYEMSIPWWKVQNYIPTTHDFFSVFCFHMKNAFWYHKAHKITLTTTCWSAL